jgi:putative transport protein
VEIAVTNPNIFDKEIGYIKKAVDKELVISRIGRNRCFIVASEKEKVQQGDIIYGVSTINYLDNLRLKIGTVKITNKREISGNLAMFHVLVTNRKLAGKTIDQIGIYRRYEANITRIFRSGMEILPTFDTTVDLGDTVRVVGKRDLLPEIKNELGNSVRELAHPNVVPIFLGIFLGIIVGSVPFFIPGLPAPAKLGLAGGPLLVAILLGHKGRIRSLDFYMTPGANMMIRELGIILFLSCVGLSAGGQLIQTIINGGYMWLLYGMVITFVPIFLAAIISRWLKINYLKICGILAGSMTDPPTLEFANSLAPIQAQSTAYATVYPLTMFLRILFAQALILLTL